MATVGGSESNAGRSEATMAEVLYKWTNYGKGWRSRWFRLCNDVLSYTKIRRTKNLNLLMSPTSDDIMLIGEISANRLSRLDRSGRRKHHQKIIKQLCMYFFFFLIYGFVFLDLGLCSYYSYSKHTQISTHIIFFYLVKINKLIFFNLDADVAF